jgi:hypothetical protein
VIEEYNDEDETDIDDYVIALWGNESLGADDWSGDE